MRLRWVRQQVGLYVAFDDRGNDVGYIFHRGPNAWSANSHRGYAACKSLGQAKAEVARQIEHPELSDAPEQQCACGSRVLSGHLECPECGRAYS